MRCRTQLDWSVYCQQDICCISYCGGSSSFAYGFQWDTVIHPPRLATQLAFYPACEQCQLTPGAWVSKLSLPVKNITHLLVFTTQAMVNLSVNLTRGHSSHKWLLVFSTVRLCGLLIPIQKLVYLGRLHMRPIQWHLRNSWRVPDSLGKVIPVHSTPSKMVVVGWQMCFKVNHYTYLNMLCKSLQMHQEGRVRTEGNTLQGEPGPFQKQVTHKISGTKAFFWP